MPLAVLFYFTFVSSKTTWNILIWSQAQKMIPSSSFFFWFLFLKWFSNLLIEGWSCRWKVLFDLPVWETLTPQLGPLPSASAATLLIFLVICNINVSVCSAFQEIRSCRSLAESNKGLLKLGCTYITWHWVLYTHYLEKNEIDPTHIERKNDFQIFCSLVGAFTELFQYSFIVCEVPHPPTIKQKQPLMSEGREEQKRVEKDHTKPLLMMEI